MIPHSKALTLVKSTQTVVSEFVGATLDPCYTKGKLNTFPTILKRGNSFFIDYSNSTNVSDLKYLKKFFSGLTTGNTFSISGGTYFIEEIGVKYNFSGEYILQNKLGEYNNYIYLTGTTYSPLLIDGLYQSKNFLTDISFNSKIGNTAQFFKSSISKEDPFNLEFLGLYGSDYSYEEYLEISGASSNAGRYKIQNFVKLSDGSEIVYIDPSETIISEDMYFKNNTINIYMRGVPDLNTLSKNKNENGIVKKITKEGKVLQILGEQNQHQKYCRSISDSTNYYDWYGSVKLANMQNIYNPVAYDGLSVSINSYSFIKIGVTSETGDLDPLTGTFTTISIPTLIVDGVETASVSYKLRTYTTNPIIKFDLSDASLIGWKIVPYIDDDLSINLKNYYFMNGVPGYDGSSFIYIKKIDSPSTIYLRFEQKNTLKLTITM